MQYYILPAFIIRGQNPPIKMENILGTAGREEETANHRPSLPGSATIWNRLQEAWLVCVGLAPRG